MVSSCHRLRTAHAIRCKFVIFCSRQLRAVARPCDLVSFRLCLWISLRALFLRTRFGHCAFAVYLDFLPTIVDQFVAMDVALDLLSGFVAKNVDKPNAYVIVTDLMAANGAPPKFLSIDTLLDDTDLQLNSANRFAAGLCFFNLSSLASSCANSWLIKP